MIQNWSGSRFDCWEVYAFESSIFSRICPKKTVRLKYTLTRILGLAHFKRLATVQETVVSNTSWWQHCTFGREARTVRMCFRLILCLCGIQWFVIGESCFLGPKMPGEKSPILKRKVPLLWDKSFSIRFTVTTAFTWLCLHKGWAVCRKILHFHISSSGTVG